MLKSVITRLEVLQKESLKTKYWNTHTIKKKKNIELSEQNLSGKRCLVSNQYQVADMESKIPAPLD